MNDRLGSAIVATTLIAGLFGTVTLTRKVIAQDYFSKGGGGGGGASTPGPWAMTNGSKIDDVSNGVIVVTAADGSTAPTFQMGTGAAGTKFQTTTSRTIMQRVDGAGSALSFGGTRPGTCNTSDIWSGASGPAYLCTGFATWRALGPTAVASSVVGGAATPAAYSGGNAVFRIVVSGTPTQLTFTLEAAETGWFCSAENITANAAHRANQRVTQLSGSTTAVVLENQNTSTGAAAALVAADEVRIHCHQF